MKVVVFTDGACTNNGKAGAQASWACWFPDHPNISKAERVPESEPQTNQRGELMAISKAVEIIKANFPYETNIQIYTDSKYSIDCLTTWLPSWVAKNWKTSQGADVKHRDIIESTSSLLSKFEGFIFTHVKAHTGKDDYESKNNHIVDRMAVRVIDPEQEDIVIESNTEVAIEGLPVSLMGPPVSDRVLIQWCLSNLDKLDQSDLNNALLSTLTKTLKKKGFDLPKQRLHKTALYRLIPLNHLITETTTITKEE